MIDKLKARFDKNELFVRIVAMYLNSYEKLVTKEIIDEITVGDARLRPSAFAAFLSSAFIEDDKRKMIYLEPNRFKNATDEDWNKYFYGTEADGYFKGEHMDLSIVFPYSERAEDGAWRSSRHKAVVAYLLDQINFEK